MFMTENRGRPIDSTTAAAAGPPATGFVKPGLRRGRALLRVLTAIGFVAAGANHFYRIGLYERLIPPGFPSPRALVLISGFFEIAGGLGLLVRPLRRYAGWGLIALLIAVFPANLYMAISPKPFADLHIPYWMLLARLPIQAGLIWLVAVVGSGE
jgi:uncharacterized membrane protein